MAAEHNWGDTLSGRLSLVVTETATNLLKHATAGEIHLRSCLTDDPAGVEMLAFDRGPGMADPLECAVDGFSSQGTAGNGLGAIARLADQFDIYSLEGKGTSIVARVFNKTRADPLNGSAYLHFGVIQVPVRGEHECGDSWGVRHHGSSSIAMLADGLGHGPDAAAASRQAVKVLVQATDLQPVSLLKQVHLALRPTRGAAVAVASVDTDENLVRFAGIGNVSAMVVTGTASRQMISHNGTAGHNVRNFQEFQYPWSSDSLLIMHSDGITTRWRLDAYPGLRDHDPSLLASVLFRDESRGHDDACILVGRQPQ